MSAATSTRKRLTCEVCGAETLRVARNATRTTRGGRRYRPPVTCNADACTDAVRVPCPVPEHAGAATFRAALDAGEPDCAVCRGEIDPPRVPRCFGCGDRCILGSIRGRVDRRFVREDGSVNPGYFCGRCWDRPGADGLIADDMGAVWDRVVAAECPECGISGGEQCVGAGERAGSWATVGCHAARYAAGAEAFVRENAHDAFLGRVTDLLRRTGVEDAELLIRRLEQLSAAARGGRP